MITDTTAKPVSAIEQMAAHKGACDAVLRACRLLRAHQHGPAADLLLEHVSRIVDTGASNAAEGEIA